MQHLYNYTEIRRKSPNRKLLRNWIRYITEHEIPDGECYNHSTEFMMTDESVVNKKRSTKRNYNSEINQFNEYVYGVEGWILPWNRAPQPETHTVTDVKEPEQPTPQSMAKVGDSYSRWRKETRTHNEEEDDDEEECDPEYKAFLEKYERLK